MNSKGALFTGAGIGAVLMYFSDPDRGRRRRARVKDKLASAASKLPDAVSATARDVRNRTAGLAAEARSRFGNAESSNEVVEARVRSKMGRIVSHPHSIEVKANDGRVMLSGPVLASEVDQLVACVSSVNGVTGVINHLDVHKQPGQVPGLQGGKQRPGDEIEFMQENWSPATRLIAAFAGGAVTVWAIKRRSALATTLGIVGLGLVARSIANVEFERMIGIGGGRRAVELQKNININAPVEQVFDFWNHAENFPRFMTNVREVREIGDGRSHWVVNGPAGTCFEWDAIVTKRIPNQLLAWKTEPGALVKSAGIVRFTGTNGSTSVDVKLSYNPPAGAIGHAAAAALGSDPTTLMDQDLMRMKTLIETGNPPHDAAATTQAPPTS